MSRKQPAGCVTSGLPQKYPPTSSAFMTHRSKQLDINQVPCFRHECLLRDQRRTGRRCAGTPGRCSPRPSRTSRPWPRRRRARALRRTLLSGLLSCAGPVVPGISTRLGTTGTLTTEVVGNPGFPAAGAQQPARHPAEHNGPQRRNHYEGKQDQWQPRGQGLTIHGQKYGEMVRASCRGTLAD